MRYRIDSDGVTTAAHNGSELITATVWFTLAVGIVFIAAGIRGRQHWLQFWGGLTCLSCALYFGRDWLNLAALFS